MLRGTDVSLMMVRVQTALARAERDGALDRPLFIHLEGDREFGIAQLRGPATLDIEFFSGSGRPVIGNLIRFVKRVTRRLLRWYIRPLAEQQSRFNHELLSLMERMRAHNERLELELHLLRQEVARRGDDHG